MNYEQGQEVTVNIKGVPTQAIYRGWSVEYNMAIVEVDGKRLYRKIRENGSHRTTSPVPAKPSRFDVNMRFDFIDQVCQMVIEGESKSVIISGSGGLGKTYTVMSRLKAAGLNDSSSEEGADYEVVKGFTTPKSLYRLLWNNRERLVIFDDCDSVWDNPTSVSLLKAALDSYETRTISWLSELRSNDEDDLPQQFEFNGKIIFVSNLALTQLDQAVLSRCLYVDVSMTPEEKIERIRSLAPAIRPDMTMESKMEVVEVLAENADKIGDLNIRTFLKGCEIRHRNCANWEQLLEYVITAL